LQFLLRFGDITENYYTTNRMIKKVFYDIFPNLFTLYPHGVYSDVSENAKHCHHNKKRVAFSYSLFMKPENKIDAQRASFFCKEGMVRETSAVSLYD